MSFWVLSTFLSIWHSIQGYIFYGTLSEAYVPSPSIKLSTLSHFLLQAGTDLFYFLFIFLVVFFGFVMMAHLTFGAEVNMFSSFVEAIGSCWQFIIGNPPSFDSLFSTNRVLGPLVFYSLSRYKLIAYWRFIIIVLFAVHGFHLLCAS
jgi:hypothetical protein